MLDIDVERRFGGVRRLYGEASLAKFKAAHVCVIGIGGVGSWAVEALARSSVGKITLIDLDNIAESNVNRQLHAVEDNFGKAKVSAMHERVMQINPLCKVIEIEECITLANVSSLLNHIDFVLDATDDVKAKIALAHYCKLQTIPLVMVGGAGGRLDPTRMRIADLSLVTGDKLLAKVRSGLRRDHQFPKAQHNKKSTKFFIQTIYSDELVIKPDAACETDVLTGLNCAGYGSSVCVTAPFGFAAASLILQAILNNQSGL